MTRVRQHTEGQWPVRSGLQVLGRAAELLEQAAVEWEKTCGTRQHVQS